MVPKVLLLIESSRVYGRQLLQGIGEYARHNGPWVMYNPWALVFKKVGSQKKILETLQNWGPDGIIMRESEEFEKNLTSIDLPIIAVPYIREKIPGMPNVLADNAAIGEMGAAHLLERGFRFFAFCGFSDVRSQKRYESFSRKISEAGFDFFLYKPSKSRTRMSWENEEIHIANWLKGIPKPVGVMACTDARSQQINDACKIEDLHVPSEVAIIGVGNDDLICELSDPPLTSIALNAQHAGYEAAALLARLMKGENAWDQNIDLRPTHVISRQSTDTLAVEDDEVAEAIKYIRQYATKGIGVDNVVNATTVSRRTLELNFQSTLGHSISTEIRQTQLERTVQLLIETELTSTQLANKVGFRSCSYLGQVFKKHKGMTLQQFRKKHRK